jgi:hypothetical protein
VWWGVGAGWVRRAASKWAAGGKSCCLLAVPRLLALPPVPPTNCRISQPARQQQQGTCGRADQHVLVAVQSCLEDAGLDAIERLVAAKRQLGPLWQLCNLHELLPRRGCSRLHSWHQHLLIALVCPAGSQTAEHTRHLSATSAA